ncbi:unnamed protein product [Polarella glacialis]|uniref:SAM-dependent methyltransferase n=1 Tax=Polarella glacialis TaxID=89957 RepID=A0A813HNI3_POLGL|nr:unnamed protein product [Polarella glacialis]
MEVLQRILPADSVGDVLEVGSGPGQHCAAFARGFPLLRWQPSEVDERFVPSIRHHAAGLNTVLEAVVINAASSTWPVDVPANRFLAVVCINVTHISPWATTKGLVVGAGRALQRGGHLIIYGPFKINGAFKTESNERFDTSLRAQDPEWGYRDAADVVALCVASDLHLAEPYIEMPANNHVLHFIKH